MTEKRFVKTHKTINWWAVLDNGKELLENEVVELLNELHEENEQLKTTIQQLRTDNTKQKKQLNTTMKENEQLKIALKDKENLISICEKKFKELGYLITCDEDGYVIE